MNARPFPRQTLRKTYNRGLAFDRGGPSVRSVDRDGRLHVETTNLSRAMICIYHATEIPRWRELGLDEGQTYRLLRDPEELKKAAATFNRLPLLSEHLAVSTAKPAPELVIGSTGSDAEFVFPFLTNSLVVWDQPSIDGIESGEKREISAGYYYRAVMEPGVFEGEKFDGRMVEIVGSHVALVVEGRCGPSVLVADSLMELNMKITLSRKAAFVNGALIAHVFPVLAQDAKVDFTPYLADVTAANFKASRTRILAGVRRSVAGKLAQDAALDLDAVAQLLEALENIGPGEDEEAPTVEKNVERAGKVAEGAIKTATDDADPLAKVQSLLKGKISDEALAEISALLGVPAEDAESEAEKTSRLEHFSRIAKREQDQKDEAAKLAGTESEPPLEAAAMDSKAAAGFESRYGSRISTADQIGVRGPAARVNVAGGQARAAHDAKPAAAKGFSSRYPDEGRIRRL